MLVSKVLPFKIWKQNLKILNRTLWNEIWKNRVFLVKNGKFSNIWWRHRRKGAILKKKFYYFVLFTNAYRCAKFYDNSLCISGFMEGEDSAPPPAPTRGLKTLNSIWLKCHNFGTAKSRVLDFFLMSLYTNSND